MNVKICDNCNEYAAIEDQDCITLRLRYSRCDLHFCGLKCLTEYVNKESDQHELELAEITNKIVEIIGNDNIEKINELSRYNDDSLKTPRDSLSKNRLIYEALIRIIE